MVEVQACVEQGHDDVADWPDEAGEGRRVRVVPGAGGELCVVGVAAGRRTAEVVACNCDLVGSADGEDLPYRVVFGEEERSARAEAFGDQCGERRQLRGPADCTPAAVDQVELDQIGREGEHIGQPEVGGDSGCGGLGAGEVDGDFGDVDTGDFGDVDTGDFRAQVRPGQDFVAAGAGQLENAA